MKKETKYLIIFELALLTPWIVVGVFGEATWETLICALFYGSALLYFYTKLLE